MTDLRPQFQQSDLDDELPPPGYYRSSITSARFRRSARGNDMIQLVYQLEDAPGTHSHVTEYFVVGGATPRTLAFARRRLAQLYRACGFSPEEGDEIDPADLLGSRLEVRVEHDEWRGESRLRVARHRALDPTRTPF